MQESTINTIVDALLGQNHTESEIADTYNITVEQIEEIMVDAGCERCETCDYWFEASETIDENNEPTYQCESCRKYG